MKDLTVKCFDDQGAEAELEKCPEIVQDYVKKLKGSRDNWKNICADAVAKLRNRSKNNDVSPVVSGCNLSIDEMHVTVSAILTAKKYTNKKVAGFKRMEKLENKLTTEIKTHYNR